MRSLLGSLGGNWGWDFLYLGRNDISYTHLGCFSALGGAGGGRRAFGNASQMSVFQIRQAVPVGLAARFCSWARWGRFFIEKKVYYSSYHIFMHNVLFYKPLGRRERMDGVEWVWMLLSQLGRGSQLGLLGLNFAAGLGFS